MVAWEKVKLGSAAVAAIVVPVVLADVGNIYTTAMKERELQGRFVEIATDILREEPKPGSEALRSWGVDIIDRYSAVPFSADARGKLIESETLPRPEGVTAFSHSFHSGSPSLTESAGDSAAWQGRVF
jgi:hypothetical protein